MVFQSYSLFIMKQPDRLGLIKLVIKWCQQCCHLGTDQSSDVVNKNFAR